jgi:hypothetical protein
MINARTHIRKMSNVIFCFFLLIFLGNNTKTQNTPQPMEIMEDIEHVQNLSDLISLVQTLPQDYPWAMDAMLKAAQLSLSDDFRSAEVNTIQRISRLLVAAALILDSEELLKSHILSDDYLDAVTNRDFVLAQDSSNDGFIFRDMLPEVFFNDSKAISESWHGTLGNERYEFATVDVADVSLIVQRSDIPFGNVKATIPINEQIELAIEKSTGTLEDGCIYSGRSTRIYLNTLNYVLLAIRAGALSNIFAKDSVLLHLNKIVIGNSLLYFSLSNGPSYSQRALEPLEDARNFFVELSNPRIDRNLARQTAEAVLYVAKLSQAIDNLELLSQQFATLAKTDPDRGLPGLWLAMLAAYSRESPQFISLANDLTQQLISSPVTDIVRRVQFKWAIFYFSSNDAVLQQSFSSNENIFRKWQIAISDEQERFNSVLNVLADLAAVGDFVIGSNLLMTELTARQSLSSHTIYVDQRYVEELGAFSQDAFNHISWQLDDGDYVPSLTDLAKWQRGFPLTLADLFAVALECPTTRLNSDRPRYGMNGQEEDRATVFEWYSDFNKSFQEWLVGQDFRKPLQEPYILTEYQEIAEYLFPANGTPDLAAILKVVWIEWFQIPLIHLRAVSITDWRYSAVETTSLTSTASIINLKEEAVSQGEHELAKIAEHFLNLRAFFEKHYSN